MSVAYAVILVDSTSHALRLEKILVHYALPCKLIPVPRHLSSDCGVCVRIHKQDMEGARLLIIENQVSFQAIEAI